MYGKLENTCTTSQKVKDLSNTFVKIYGSERSGTNYLKFLLETNFNAIVFDLPLGNKHEEANPEMHLEKLAVTEESPTIDLLRTALHNGDVRYLHISKPLVSWLPSFHDYRILKSKKASTELTDSAVKTYSELWSSRNVQWSRFIETRPLAKSISLDDLVREDINSHFLESLANELKLERKNGDIFMGDGSQMKRSHDGQHGDDIVDSRRKFDVQKYLSREKSRDLSLSQWEVALRAFFLETAPSIQRLNLFSRFVDPKEIR